MSEELSFEALERAIAIISGKDNCDHIPVQLGSLYIWECKCGKVQEMRLPPDVAKALREDVSYFHKSCREGKGSMTMNGIKLKPYFSKVCGIEMVSTSFGEFAV